MTKFSDIIPLPLAVVGTSILVLVVLIIIMAYIPVRYVDGFTNIPKRTRLG